MHLGPFFATFAAFCSNPLHGFHDNVVGDGFAELGFDHIFERYGGDGATDASALEFYKNAVAIDIVQLQVAPVAPKNGANLSVDCLFDQLNFLELGHCWFGLGLGFFFADYALNNFFDFGNALAASAAGFAGIGNALGCG
jgi:hypothetical protein